LSNSYTHTSIYTLTPITTTTLIALQNLGAKRCQLLRLARHVCKLQRFVANCKSSMKKGFPKEPKGSLMPKLKDALEVTLTGLGFLYLAPELPEDRYVRLRRIPPEKAPPRHESPEHDDPLSPAKSRR